MEKYLKLYSYHYLINGFAVLVTQQQGAWFQDGGFETAREGVVIGFVENFCVVRHDFSMGKKEWVSFGHGPNNGMNLDKSGVLDFKHLMMIFFCRTNLKNEEDGEAATEEVKKSNHVLKKLEKQKQN
ncbi:hypothetical protein JHK87_052852 [Glycine soja]|nr:hypothetical protein JHK87_052852 [Glycine soja]